jgi:hypothetical protein
MKKNYFLLLLALMGVAGKSSAQEPKVCGSDEMRRELIKAHPELLEAEASYEKQIAEALKRIDLRAAKKTTFVDQSGNPDFWYDIPIVVHVVHDYGVENISDDNIFKDFLDWNIVYAKQNSDTSNVIPPFVKYVGNPHIRLHFATKDPYGRPTKGITRERNYLTYNGGNQSKFNDWPPSSYINIWTVNIIHGKAAAFAMYPADAAGIPYYDGVISDYDYVPNSPYTAGQIGKTINHEIGHMLNLQHVWGNTNDPAVACGDDGVDDTPPTKGHNPTGCAADRTALYDTTCSRNYFKIYTNIAGNDSLVNYPDTNNSQNIMDYTYCARMFTKGQVERMHAALNSDVSGRSNLWSRSNLLYTGVITDSVTMAWAPRPDLKPIPEFYATVATLSPTAYMKNPQYFNFPGGTVTFRNETWNDTLESLNWTFSNGATSPTSTSTTSFTNSFTDPGWVDVKMTAKGNNNTGDTTVEWPRGIFIADATGTPAATYTQDFNSADTAKWPTFNYYNNEFAWKLSNVGFAGFGSMEYLGFDRRLDPSNGQYPVTGMPAGDFDDMFTVPMDLSSFSGACSMNYFYAGATRSSNTNDMNDTLEIAYSVNKSQSWTTWVKLTKASLANKGAIATAFTPTSDADWAQMSLNVPAAARTPYTVFRFRYRPSVGVGYDGTLTTGQYSSGNNFFLDRLFFSPFPAGVANVVLDKTDVVVAPNPTNGDAYVIVKDADNNAVANIVVTDITGKVVYRTSEQLTGGEGRIQIPHAAIAVSGMYIVQTATGNQIRTQKLVVE